SHLVFPSVCTDCGHSTDTYVGVRLSPHWSALLALGHHHRYFDLTIPFCLACQSRCRRKRRYGALVGVVLGAAGLACISLKIPDAVTRVVLPIFGALF